MSKKILSLALAVVMLVSVFAFTASATTFPAEGQIGYRVVSNAYVGMPAGEEVVVEVYLVLPDTDSANEDFRLVAHNIPLCYTTSYFTYESFELGDYYANGVFTPTAENTTIYNTLAKKFTDAETSKGYDKAVQVQMKLDAFGEYTSTTGFKPNIYEPVFKVTFTTADVLDDSAIIGIPASAVTVQLVPQYKNSSNKNTKYTLDNIILSESIMDSSSMYVDINAPQAILLRNNAADANTVDVGFIATFMDAAFAAEFAGNGTTCTNLDNIGIDVRINGTVQSGVENADLNVIYPIDGGYQFVGAVTGIDADNLDTKIEARAYMIDSDGTTYYSNWIACNANLRYDDAVDAGMNAIA